MMGIEDMKIAAYTMLVVVAYTLLIGIAPDAAVAVFFPCCCALILPCVVHLRKRAARRNKRERARVT